MIHIKGDKGITLVALIVTIIILIVLSAVAIKSFTGEEGLVGAAAGTTEDYKVADYKERVELQVRSTILERATIGKEANLEDIAAGLISNTTWVKEAHANMDKTITNEDVIVETTDGYLYQVCMNNTYGAIFVEYIGRKKAGEIPNIIARYEKNIASVIVKTKVEQGKIEKVELTYKGEAIRTVTDIQDEMRIDIKDNGIGWYGVRVTTDKGQQRYAWIRIMNVVDYLKPPEIKVTPDKPDGQENWYRTIPVQMSMSTDSKPATEIHYVLSGAGAKAETKVDGKTANVQIESLGRTSITAWTEDGRGYQSEIVTKEVKLDNKIPTVSHTEECVNGQVGYWYKGEVTIKVSGEDEHSQVEGYYYKAKNQSEFLRKNMTDVLKVGSEGVTEVIVKTKDIAGNESKEKTITIHKDTEAPDEAMISFKSNAKNSITVEAMGNDNTSGVSGYTFEYRERDAAGDNWKKLANGAVTSNAGRCTYTYEGLPRGEYDLRVIVTDAAGNDRQSDVLSTSTILNFAPVFTNDGTSTDVTRTSMNIKAAATDEDGDTLTYILHWGETSSVENITELTGSAGSTVTFSKTELGMDKTYYWRVDVTDGKLTTQGQLKNRKNECK